MVITKLHLKHVGMKLLEKFFYGFVLVWEEIQTRFYGKDQILEPGPSKSLIPAKKARGILFPRDIGFQVRWDRDIEHEEARRSLSRDPEFVQGFIEERYEYVRAWIEDSAGRLLATEGGIFVDYKAPDPWMEYLRGYEDELLWQAEQLERLGNHS